MVVFHFAQTSAAYMLSVVEHLQCLSVEYGYDSRPASKQTIDQYQAESAVSRRVGVSVSLRRMVMPAPFLQPAGHAPQSSRQYLGSYISLGQAQGVGRQIRI
jgi:hypothetical protein